METYKLSPAITLVYYLQSFQAGHREGKTQEESLNSPAVWESWEYRENKEARAHRTEELHRFTQASKYGQCLWVRKPAEAGKTST